MKEIREEDAKVLALEILDRGILTPAELLVGIGTVAADTRCGCKGHCGCDTRCMDMPFDKVGDLQ